MEKKIVIAGFGGQGVLSLGQFIAHSAMHEGKGVTWLPSYGPEMRGGTANCSVVVSDETVASPIIAYPDVLIAMNKPSLDKFEQKVVKGGVIIINSSLIDQKIKREDVKAVYINANDLANEVGNTKTANIIILGAFIKLTNLISKEVAKKSIEKIFANKPKVIPLNLTAFDKGYEIV